MKHLRTIVVLSFMITVLAAIAASVGLFSDWNNGGEEYTFTSIWGENIPLHGSGVYSHDSVSTAAQAKAQDGVTLFFAIPLLLCSLFMTARGSIKGRMLLTGTLAYFLYTYASYSFLAMYNPLFLIYVLLLSISFFAFILTLVSFDKQLLHTYFENSLPAKGISVSLFFIACMLLLLWLAKIINSLRLGTPPQGLEHYSTLVIQGLDLGIIAPVAIVTGLMVIRRQPFGYLLAAMIYSGVEVSMAECVIFPAMTVVVIVCMFVLLKHVCEPLRQ